MNYSSRIQILPIAFLCVLLFGSAAVLSAAEDKVKAKKNTLVFTRECKEAQKGGAIHDFSIGSLFADESSPACSGECDCTTCSCSGSISCCGAGCGACWQFLDDGGYCGAAT